MHTLAITSTSVYRDALKAEARRMKRRVDQLGAISHLRAEVVAWQTLERIEEAVNNILSKERMCDDSVIPNDETIVESTPKETTTKVAASFRPSKKQLALAAFAQHRSQCRKDIIAAMIAAADLTAAGAATYYQNIKSCKSGWEI